MSQLKANPAIKEVHGELTRLLLLYWEIMGRPDLSEFMALIPMEPALEYIEKSKKNEHQWSGEKENLH